MKWFKFYGQDYLSDPKILSLCAADRSCWITLLSYASVNDNGTITYLSEEQLKMQAGVSPTHDEWDYTTGVLKKFEKLGMISIDNEVITVTNWQKRQEINLTSYERVKRWREKKRKETQDNENDNSRIEENRIDNTPSLSEKRTSALPVPEEEFNTSKKKL